MLNLPPEALVYLRQHVALVTHERAGQRLIALKLANELLAKHGLHWIDIVDAAFMASTTTVHPPKSSAAQLNPAEIREGAP